MPQGDDFITDPTPAPPVDPETPPAATAGTAAPASVPEVDDLAAPAPADDSPAPSPPDETPEQLQRKSDRAFAAMRRANDAQAARIAALEARLTPTPDPTLDRRPGQAPAPAAPAASQAPQPENYPTHAAYVQDVAKWAVEQHEQVKAATATATSIQTAWESQETQAKTKFADYDEALAADTTRYHPAVLEAIQTSDQGAEVAYHLATHPEDATRIAALAPGAALRALGRLEAQLAPRSEGTSAPAAAASPDPTPTPTPKPRPLAPVGGAGTGGSTVAPDQLPYDEYVGWYKKTFGSR